MFVFEMFKPFLIVIIWLQNASECVCTFPRVFPREVIFSPVMNPDGENLFLYPLLLLFSSPSASDSGVRLCFLLALWFMVVMIYCVWVA